MCISAFCSTELANDLPAYAAGVLTVVFLMQTRHAPANVLPVPAEAHPASMYLTYPLPDRGFTVTDSPGFSPDSMCRVPRMKGDYSIYEFAKNRISYNEL